MWYSARWRQLSRWFTPAKTQGHVVASQSIVPIVRPDTSLSGIMPKHPTPTHPITASHSVLKKSEVPGICIPPVGYVQVWNGIHTSGDNTGALWKPLPQGKDYVAMGYVAVGRYSPELPTNLVCVHKSAAFLASCGGSLWSDHGSRSHRTCSIWSVKPSLDYLNLGTFVATRGYRAPPTGEFWALRPDIIPLPVGVKLFASYARAGDMALMYRDYGTGAEDHVSVYNPVAPTGYMPLEHYAHPGYHISPLAKIASVKEEGRTGLCAHPLKFRRVDWQRYAGKNTSSVLEADSPSWICVSEIW